MCCTLLSSPALTTRVLLFRSTQARAIILRGTCEFQRELISGARSGGVDVIVATPHDFIGMMREWRPVAFLAFFFLFVWAIKFRLGRAN